MNLETENQLLSEDAQQLLQRIRRNGTLDLEDSPALRELVERGRVQVADSYRTFPAGTRASTKWIVAAKAGHMITQSTEVIGTVRSPDGAINAEIDGLVFGSRDSPQIIEKADAIRAAQQGLLWCRVPGGGRAVDIEARDFDHDGVDDHVATKPDATRANNLYRLNIWIRGLHFWVDWQGNRL